MDFFSHADDEAAKEATFEWLDDVSDYRERARREKLFHAGYFSVVDYRSNYKTRNQLLMFEPDLRYEKWLSHGAIPHCFRPFICNLAYVGRPELALYVRLILLMDQFGVCYDTPTEITKGVFDHLRRSTPLFSRLEERHLILRSEKEVYIPWITAEKRRTRKIFQRPKAAYTIARLHYYGYPLKAAAKAKQSIARVGEDRGYLDIESFEQCVDLLLRGYLGQEGRNVERPEAVSSRQMKQWMLERFLTSEEREALQLVEGLQLDGDLNHVAAARDMPSKAIKKRRRRSAEEADTK